MMEKNSKIKKEIIKTICFLLFVILLISSVVIFTAQLSDRQNGSYRQFEAFYAQKPGTVDVLFVGSSRVHTNINPVGLWENYGIPSYCLGLNVQSVDTSYYALKEAFRYQNYLDKLMEYDEYIHDDAIKEQRKALW